MNAIPASRIALLAAIAFLIMSPSFLFGPGATHSVIYNFMWTSQFGDAIEHGQLYPRWLPGSFEGLGSPAFYFYPPIAYWLSGAFDALGLSTLQAINMAGLVLLFASGVTMYLWLAERGTRPMLGAMLYMVAPYHFLDFWVRGALAEFAAFVWLPLIALGVMRLPQRRGVTLLALSYAAMILTHLPVAMLTGIFLIAPLTAWRVWEDRATLLPAAGAGALALGLAAFYLLPAMSLQDRIASTLFWAHGYSPAHFSIWNDSFVPFLCFALGFIVLAASGRSVWTLIAVIASLASIKLIPFIWDYAPLDKAQFPWRLFCIAEFATLTALLASRPRLLTIGVGVALLIPPYVFSIGLAVHDLRIKTDYAAVAREMPEAPEYLPAGFDLSLVTHPDRKTNVAAYRTLPSASGDILVGHAGPVTLHRAAFPIWRVTRDGHEVPSTGPLISFDATPGHYRVERVLIWQEVAGWLSTLGAGLVILLLALGKLPQITPPPLRPSLLAARRRKTV